MKTRITDYLKISAVTLLTGALLLCTGCTKTGGDPMDLGKTLVGIYNTTNKWPATKGTTDEFLDGNNRRMTTVVSISGEFSAGYKTLLSFNGSRTLTQLDLSVGGYSDIVEQKITLKDVPMEVESDNLRAMIVGKAAKYVTSAYWRHTTINPSATVTSETGDLDFSDPATELDVTFDKVY